MKTPKEYLINLKNSIITKQMLSNALYSVNKRAKNYRDKQRQFRYVSRFTVYDYAEMNRNKKQEMYKYKQKLLSLVKPTCIHKQYISYQNDYFWYIFYDFGNYSFHIPIQQKDCKKYSNLQIIEIDNLITHGHEIQELISMQFVKKLIDLINTGQYQYIN